MEITGKNLQQASAVFCGSASSAFKLVSPEELITIIPHKSVTSAITVVTPQGRASSPFPFVIANDPRVPDEVSYKAGYVNPVPPPPDFKSALLWGIAIADPRLPGHESAEVEIASTQLTCRVDGKDVTINDDGGNVRGGLYRRDPWFGTDEHEPIRLTYDHAYHAVILPVGRRPDRVWHFWSPRPEPPFHPVASKAVPSKPASRFLPEPYCKWGWTTGAIQPLPTAPAETTTKPEPATGISRPRNGKKPPSPTSEAHNSSHVTTLSFVNLSVPCG